MHSADIRYLPTYQTGWTMVFEKWGWDARTPPPPGLLSLFTNATLLLLPGLGLLPLLPLLLLLVPFPFARMLSTA